MSYAVYPLHAVVAPDEVNEDAVFWLTLRYHHEESTGETLRRLYVCAYPFYAEGLDEWIYLSVAVEGHQRAILPDTVQGVWSFAASSASFASDTTTIVQPVRCWHVPQGGARPPQDKAVEGYSPQDYPAWWHAWAAQHDMT